MTLFISAILIDIMRKFLHQFFLPHEHNNFRPKLLHHKFLVLIIIFFFSVQLGLQRAKTAFPTVLGATTDISVQRLLDLTNSKRQQQGLPTLSLNEKLSKAAFSKGENMFAKNYWAHNAPDGTTPWYFIRQVKYNYVYAGENLARGFTKSDDIIEAWMDSPTHKENMLSPNYRDIGFAVLEGKLMNEQTTLVVEMFGNTESVPLAKQSKTAPEAQPQLFVEKSAVLGQVPSFLSKSPLVDVGLVSWYIGIGTLSVFLLVLFVDAIFIERKKIVRFVGHNVDHIIFLGFVLLFVVFISRGVII